MKHLRWLGICVAAMLLLVLAVPGVAEPQRVPLDNLSYLRDEAANRVDEGVYYYVDSVDGWVLFSAKKTGYYIFSFNRNEAYFWEIVVETAYKETLLDIYTGASSDPWRGVGAVELQANELYYININSVGAGQFAICGPARHAGLGANINFPATCAAPGRDLTVCEVCGAAQAEVEIPATGHVPGEVQVVREATCLAPGLKTVQCRSCGEVLESESIPLAEHTPGAMTEVAPVTCTEAGYFEQRCTLCNALIASEAPPAFGHRGGEWQIARDATCTAEGVRELRCALCGAVMQTEAIPAFGHSAGEMQTTREASCLQSGLKEVKCAACGAVLESEEIPALGHEYTEWEVLTEPTGESEGERQRHCVHCGDTQQEKIEKQPKFLGMF